MIAKLWTALMAVSPRFKTSVWRRWYQFLAGRHPREDWSFMNYGYAPLDPQTERLALDDADEPDRCCIQLYHHVASAVDLHGLKVLEVGSGRGGGSCYIKRYLKPERMVGVDFSEKAVVFSNKNCSVEGLSFTTGDAESLPFDDNSFDVVVNVESSHCYGSMDAFLAQVKRVLRQGGYFLYADLRGKENVDTLHERLRRSGMKIIQETNITPNVVEGLNLDDERRMTLIRESTHKLLSRLFRQFAGVKGSKIYEGFRTGSMVYLSFVLQKP